MKKIFTALTIMLCMSMSMNAIDVDVEKEDPDPFPEDRSATATVTASLECQVLTIQFSELSGFLRMIQIAPESYIDSVR